MLERQAFCPDWRPESSDRAEPHAAHVENGRGLGSTYRGFLHPMRSEPESADRAALHSHLESPHVPIQLDSRTLVTNTAA